MSAKVSIACVVGTRPEVIKMAPVIHAIRSSTWAECAVIATAQHRGLLDQALSQFQLRPDIDLDLMTPGQSLVELSARLLPALSAAIAASGSKAVLAQGDTATVFGAAQVAFLSQLPFGHVEAGLRTHDLAAPFPEEGYRQMTARIAKWHFAPTEGAARNLLGEGIAKQDIVVTGNTGIDAVLAVAPPTAPHVPDSQRRKILITAHRRESFGSPMERIFSAVRVLAEAYPQVDFVYPVHPNPQVGQAAHRLLGGKPNIRLCEPMDYIEFVQAMASCYLLLTDSGGIQEEAPALGKPVLVLREKTERPEAVEAGVARLVGTDFARIVKETSRLLDDPQAYAGMAVGSSPYGDGRAAPRILAVLERSLAGGSS